MTEDEILAINMLTGVTFPVCSWDKRFAASLRIQASLPEKLIGEKQAPQLWRIFVRYRRQTSGDQKQRLLRLADKLMAPDLRKRAAAIRAQERIDAMKREYAPVSSETSSNA